MLITLLLAGCASGEKETAAEAESQKEFVDFALKTMFPPSEAGNATSWPDSLARPAFAFDSMDYQIPGATYLGGLSTYPLRPNRAALYRADMDGDMLQEYMLLIIESGGMWVDFGFHFFHAASPFPEPYAEYSFTATDISDLQLVHHTDPKAHDLQFRYDHWQSVYRNGGIAILAIGQDSSVGLTRLDTVSFIGFPVEPPQNLQKPMLQDDEIRISSRYVWEDADHDVQTIREIQIWEVVHPIDVERDLWEPLQLLQTDTIYHRYQPDHHAFVPDDRAFH